MATRLMDMKIEEKEEVEERKVERSDEEMRFDRAKGEDLYVNTRVRKEFNW